MLVLLIAIVVVKLTDVAKPMRVAISVDVGGVAVVGFGEKVVTAANVVMIELMVIVDLDVANGTPLTDSAYFPTYYMIAYVSGLFVETGYVCL